MFSSKKSTTDCLLDDGASHVESDEGATDLPTALDVIDEVSFLSATVTEQWYPGQYLTPVKTPIVGDQNDGADTSTNDVVKSRMMVSNLLLKC